MYVCIYMWNHSHRQPAVLLFRHCSLFLRQGFFLGLGLPTEQGWPASKPQGCCNCMVLWPWWLGLASVCGFWRRNACPYACNGGSLII